MLKIRLVFNYLCLQRDQKQDRQWMPVFWLLLTVYLTQGHNVVAFNSSASDSTPCQPAKTVIYRTTNSEEEIPGGEICQRDSASLTTFTPRLKQAWGLHTHSGTKLFRAEPHWGAKVFSPVASASSSSTMTWTMENLYIHVSAFHFISYYLCIMTCSERFHLHDICQTIGFLSDVAQGLGLFWSRRSTKRKLCTVSTAAIRCQHVSTASIFWYFDMQFCWLSLLSQVKLPPSVFP